MIISKKGLVYLEQQGFCNTRKKFYPSLSGEWDLVEKMTFEKSVFNPCGLERNYEEFYYLNLDSEMQIVESALADSTMGELSEAMYGEKARKRAKKRIYDYIMCNLDMNMFVTLTYDKCKVDRYNYKEIIKKMNMWLSNRVERNGMKYILVPELHKDGAVHMHGLMNRKSLELKDSGKKRNGKIVWNVSDYVYGYTTAIQISGVREKIAAYIKKYITKQTDDDKIGGRYYLHGGALEEPRFVYEDVDYICADSTVEFEAWSGNKCKIWYRELTD